MDNVFVVVPDRACEFGAPVAVFSTKELADSYAKKKYQVGYFIFTFTMDSEAMGKMTFVDKYGKCSPSEQR